MTVTGVDAQVSAALRTGTAHGLVSATQTAKTPTTGIVAGTAARVEIEGDFYQPQPVRLVSRDGEARTNERGPFVGHEGLAYEAAHFATLLREGRTESPLLPLDETLTIMRTLDEILADIERVTLADLGRLAERLLGEPLSLVALGPKGPEIQLPDSVRV